MTIRIALAGLHMECATFLPHITGRDLFEAGTVRGADVSRSFAGSNTVMGGALTVLEEAGAEAVPILHADGGAAGTADQEAVAVIRNEIVAGLSACKDDIDGVLLHLHGALVTQTDLDPDATTVDAVRAAVGPDVPVMVAFDYHANLDAASIAGATAAFGYRFSPHIDMGATGARAATCLLRTIKGEIRPAMAIARPGLILPSIFSATDLQPLKRLVETAVATTAGPEIYTDVSLFAGFAYADVPNCGASVLAVVDGPAATAQRLAKTLSQEVDRYRAALSAPFPVLSLDEGVAAAHAASKVATRPVVLLEHADRANDSTHGLRALRGISDHARIAVPFLWDPAAVSAAMAAGPGAEVRLALGGHSAPMAGPPLDCVARVVAAKPALSFRGTSAMRKGSLVHVGDTVLLDVDGMTVIVTSFAHSAIDFDPFLQFGLEPAAFDIVLLRSKTHFRAAWEGFAATIIVIDTPDYGPADLSKLPYRHAKV